MTDLKPRPPCIRAIRFFTVLCVTTILLHHAGLTQSFTRVTTGAPVTEIGAWRSVNWVDYDRDGDLDLLVTRGRAGGQDNVLFRNDGGPGFTFTRMGGLEISQDHLPSDGSSWADYDNDGFPDAFVVNWYNANNLLYHNRGDGTLDRVLTGQPSNDGGYSEAASWGDYDNDGLVDLYVTNSGGNRMNFLYRNLGNGQFARVSAGAQSTDAGKSRGVNWVDYDRDGDLDLFITNENNENDFLYRNMHAEQGVDTFQRVTTGPLVTSGGSSWSASWADYDNDGDPDVFVAHNGYQAGRLFVNDGAGNFAADTAGPIATTPGYFASGAWGDIDNDGDLDLVATQAYADGQVTNVLYSNLLTETGAARFERVLAGPLVTDAGFQYGAAWGDYDGDGDLDLFVARTYNEAQVNALYRNDGNGNHWMTLDLRGTSSNAAAIGARVRVKAVLGGVAVWQERVVEGQSGYCGQNLQLHFGLLDAATVDSLVIDWPSGAAEVFTGVAADRHLVVVEIDSTAPSPVSPAQGVLNGSPEIRLTWTRSLHYPPYRLQVSTDPGFLGGMIADTVVAGDTSAVVRIASNGETYHWRVSPERSIHGFLWSSVRDFDNDVQVPGPVGLLSPGDGASGLPVSTGLLWTAAPRATGYRVRVSPDSTFTQSLIDTIVADTSLTAASLPYLTRLFWKVEGENFTGPGPAPAPASFTTIVEAPALPELLSPAPGEGDVSVPALITWRAADRAESYRLQVSTESLFVPPFLREMTVADTSVLLDDLASLTTHYWRLRSINAGGQSPYGPSREFRTVLAAPEAVSPPDSSSQFSDVTLTWRMTTPAITYRLQLGTDSSFAAPAFDDSTLTDTSHSTLVETGRRYLWRVRAAHSQGVSPWSAVRSFVSTPDTFLVTAGGPWNLVSLPGNVPDRSVYANFPGAESPFYRYTGSYETADTMEYGVGYWVRLAPGTDVRIAGTKRPVDTIEVTEGWNLVSSVSSPLPVAEILTVPPGLVSSPFFGYEGGFGREDTLRPGRGYWVRAHQEGSLILGADRGASSTAHLQISPEPEEPPPPPGEGSSGLLVGGTEAGIPAVTALLPNYPNPFNPATEIRFQLAAPGDVLIEVFDALGSRVETLVDGAFNAGSHSVTWGAAGRASGLYFTRMVAGTTTETRKMLLLR